MTLYITLGIIGFVISLYLSYNLGRNTGIRQLHNAIKEEIKNKD